jgi:hypothetical protein
VKNLRERYEPTTKTTIARGYPKSPKLLLRLLLLLLLKRIPWLVRLFRRRDLCLRVGGLPQGTWSAALDRALERLMLEALPEGEFMLDRVHLGRTCSHLILKGCCGS